MLKLFDASSHQPVINWDQVKRGGYDGAIIKATGGNAYVNPVYQQQIAGARSVGLLVGHYHYDGEPSVGSGTAPQEAAYFLAHADVRPGELVALDAEERATRNIARYNIWRGIVGAAVGCTPLLYTFQSFITELGAQAWLPLADMPLWYAWYPDSGRPDNWPAPPGPWATIAIWQWSGGTSVPGIPNPTDANLFDGTREELTALGKPDPTNPTPGASIVTPASDWGPGSKGRIVHRAETIIVINDDTQQTYLGIKIDGNQLPWQEVK